MVLDQLVIRAFADKGDDWNEFAAAAVAQVPRQLRKGVLMMLRHVRAHLRRNPPLSLPVLVPVIFLGLTAFPAALALALSA
jgi:hypothetical protein